MKILAAVDFHGAPAAEKNLTRFLKSAYDCLVLMGDLTNFGPASFAEPILSCARDAGVPTFAIPGNCDPKQILNLYDDYGVNLHCRSKKLGDITFIGFGGSNLTPFNTPFEFTEMEIQEELIKLAPPLNETCVLVTHAPPFDTKIDQIADGTHVGSKSIRRFIEERQPLVALSGHVHEARDVDKLGRTTLINPGPISRGYAAELSISRDRVDVELLEL